MINSHKIGFMPTGSYNGMPVASICDSLKKIGYDAVEWHLGFFCPRRHNYAQLKEIVNISQRSGLEISEIVVQQDLVTKDDQKRYDNIKYVKECIEVFSSLGITTINLFTGPIPWNENNIIIGKDISEGKAWEMVLHAFEELVALAEKNRIHLALKMFGVCYATIFTLRNF